MEAAVTGHRCCTADSNKDDLNGRTVEPSELVPSGNKTTSDPRSIAWPMRSIARVATNLRSRSIKIVPAARANQPKNGHAATSRFEIKMNGLAELRTMTTM